MPNAPDNYSQWKSREAQQESWLNSRPVCSYCDEHIQDERCFDDGDKILCLDCLKNHFIKWTDDYIA